METEGEFRKINKIVLEVLNEDERARNDDNWLTWRVLRYFTDIRIPFEDFVKLPRFGTISRCRRQIQNKYGLFPPTDEVVKRRRSRKKVVRSLMVDGI